MSTSKLMTTIAKTSGSLGIGGSSSKAIEFITDASTAFKQLNGIICIYKPSGGYIKSQKLIRTKICRDLNSMEPREPEEIIEIRRVEPPRSQSQSQSKSLLSPTLITSVPSDKKLVTSFLDKDQDTIQILKAPNYADHPLVIGPRFQEPDIRLYDVSKLGSKTTGLAVYGINGGTKTAFRIDNLKWLRGYSITGQFGTATDNCYYTGNIVEKSTYHKIKPIMMEHALSAFQAKHQRITYDAANLRLTSERAYEVASQGMVRPMEDHTTPMIYSMKLTDFQLPNFTIEIFCTNEKEQYLLELIYGIALKLHTTAMVTKIRCIKYGPFGVELALLQKHWNVQNFLGNIGETSEILKNHDLRNRNPVIEGM